MKQTIIIVFIVFLGIHCGNTLKINLSDQPPQSDLIIKNVTYKRIVLPQPSNPEQLGGIVIMPPEYEFKITIENIGAAEWWGDVYLQYEFYSEQNQKFTPSQYHLILMEETILPFKEKMDVRLPPQRLPLGASIEKVLFTVNPAIQDSTLVPIEHSKEFFMNNNYNQIKF